MRNFAEWCNSYISCNEGSCLGMIVAIKDNMS